MQKTYKFCSCLSPAYPLLFLRTTILCFFSTEIGKVEIGLARGKKLYDKRDDLKKKAVKREMERDFRNSQVKV